MFKKTIPRHVRLIAAFSTYILYLFNYSIRFIEYLKRDAFNVSEDTTLPRSRLFNAASPPSQCFAQSLPLFHSTGSPVNNAVLSALAAISSDATIDLLPSKHSGPAAAAFLENGGAPRSGGPWAPLVSQEALLDAQLVHDAATAAWRSMFGTAPSENTVLLLATMERYKYACETLDDSVDRWWFLFDFLPNFRSVAAKKVEYGAAREKLIKTVTSLPSVCAASKRFDVVDLGAVVVDVLSWFSFGYVFPLSLLPI